MAGIRAVFADPQSAERLTLREVDAPTPAASEALAPVAAFSLNLGEVRAGMNAQEERRIGWDFAGTVEQAAADGSGPKQGARVVGLLPNGAWAELVAAPTAALAQLPESVSFTQSATLPVAGLTALHAVEKGGWLLGQPVLINGANGGVGSFAVQLARDGGAQVVGAVRRASGVEAVRAAGAHEVVVSDDLAAAEAHGPYHLIVESAGGKALGNALGMLRSGGICVLFGTSAGAEVTFNAERFYRAGDVTLYGLRVFNEFSREPASQGLTRLATLVADGRLRPLVDVEAPWTQVAEIAQRLLNRGVTGKAVLHIAQ